MRNEPQGVPGTVVCGSTTLNAVHATLDGLIWVRVGDVWGRVWERETYATFTPQGES